MQHITGEPMLASEIDELLSRTDIVLGDITWHKLVDCVQYAVAEYDGFIQGQKVFLHLMSHETTNYWVITYPHKSMKALEQGMVLFNYNLSDITKLADSMLDVTKNDNRNPTSSV